MIFFPVRRHLEKAHGRLNEGPKKRKPPVMAVAPQDHADLQAGSLLPQQVNENYTLNILNGFFNHLQKYSDKDIVVWHCPADPMAPKNRWCFLNP